MIQFNTFHIRDLEMGFVKKKSDLLRYKGEQRFTTREKWLQTTNEAHNDFVLC